MSAQSITAQANSVTWAFFNGREYKANRMSFRHLSGRWYLQAFANISDEARVMILLCIDGPADSPFNASVALATSIEQNKAGWLNVHEEFADNYFDTYLTVGQADVAINPQGVSTGRFNVTVLDLGLDMSGSFSMTADAPYAEFSQAPSDTQGTRSSALTQPS